MYKSATKCNKTIGKWYKNKHGASKIIDTFETYHSQLNTFGVLGWFPVSGLLVIDVVGWRMYFVVMPRVNLIVILVTYARYLYSINCRTVLCLPSMLLFILWRDTTSELWTPVQFPLYCYTILLLLALFTFSHTTTIFHSIRSYLCLQKTGEIDNLIVSWEQSSWLCCLQVLRCN
jgi:hypothetical protein